MLSVNKEKMAVSKFQYRIFIENFSIFINMLRKIEVFTLAGLKSI